MLQVGTGLLRTGWLTSWHDRYRGLAQTAVEHFDLRKEQSRYSKSNRNGKGAVELGEDTFCVFFSVVGVTHSDFT